MDDPILMEVKLEPLDADHDRYGPYYCTKASFNGAVFHGLLVHGSVHVPVTGLYVMLAKLVRMSEIRGEL